MRSQLRSHPHQPCREPAAPGRPDRGEPVPRGRRGHDERAFRHELARPWRTSCGVSGRRASTFPATASTARRWDTGSTTARGGATRSSASAASSSAGPSLYDVPPTAVAAPATVVLTSFGDRRDRLRFAAAYADPESGITTGPRPPRWPVCVGPAHLYRRTRRSGPTSQLEGGARRRRRRGGLHDLHRARQRLPHRQRLLPDRRGIPLRLRRRHARGVQGHRRRRAHPAARRSGASPRTGT